MATYGSEYASSRIYFNQIIELSNNLYYLEFLLKTKSYMFGKNKLVVDSYVIPYAKIHKIIVALSFYYKR